MTKKEDRRTAITKRMLKESLLELLGTASIHNISIRELCQRADVNRSTFYKYYGSQYELLTDMENDWLESVESSMGQVTNVEEAPFVDILTFMDANMELGRLLINSNVDPEFPQRLLSLPSIKRLIASNLPSNDDNDIMEYIYHFYVNGGYHLIRHWVNKENRESPEEMAKILLLVLRHVRME